MVKWLHGFRLSPIFEGSGSTDEGLASSMTIDTTFLYSCCPSPDSKISGNILTQHLLSAMYFQFLLLIQDISPLSRDFNIQPIVRGQKRPSNYIRPGLITAIL